MRKFVSILDAKAKVRGMEAKMKQQFKVKRPSFDLELGEEGEQFEDEHEPEPEESKSNFGLIATLVFGGALGTLGLNIFAMVVYGGTIVNVAGIIASLVAVQVGWNQIQLGDEDSLRKVQNNIRKDVGRFAAQNTKLTNSINRLEGKAAILKDCEQGLKDITKDQELNVNNLVNLVKENGDIIKAKKAILRQAIIQDLMGRVFKGERDENGLIEGREVRRMINYMKGLPAVKVNEELLRESIEKNNSVHRILDLIMDIGREGEQLGDQIFVISDDEELQAHLIGEK